MSRKIQMCLSWRERGFSYNFHHLYNTPCTPLPPLPLQIKSNQYKIMDAFLCWVTISCVAAALMIHAYKILNWVWLKPKNLEKRLRRQGFDGNSYKLFSGDLKDIGIITRDAEAKPMNFTNDIVPRVYPIFHKAFQNYGMLPPLLRI